VMYIGKTVGKGNYRGKRVILLGYDIFRELYRVWDGKKVSSVKDVRFNPDIVGKSAHPPKGVQWDSQESEGESVDKKQVEKLEADPEHSDEGELDRETKNVSSDSGLPIDSQVDPTVEEHRGATPTVSLDAQDPAADHPSRRYAEGKAPTKGLTWEQSDRITPDNIVRGKREHKVRTQATPELKAEPSKKQTKDIVNLAGIRVTSEMTQTYSSSN